jgi:hypothetical protein
MGGMPRRGLPLPELIGMEGALELCLEGMVPSPPSSSLRRLPLWCPCHATYARSIHKGSSAADASSSIGRSVAHEHGRCWDKNLPRRGANS